MIGIYKKLKKLRRLLLFLFDFLLWSMSFYFSYSVSRDSFSLVNNEVEFGVSLAILSVCFIVTFLIFQLYQRVWRYAEIEDFFWVQIAVLFSNIEFFGVTFTFNIILGFRTYILTMLTSSFLFFIFRLIYRLNKVLENKNSYSKQKKRVLIVGGGETSLSILREITKSANSTYFPVCIVDDDLTKVGRSILGIKIVGPTSKIPEICEKYKIEVVLFSISSIENTGKKRILNICSKTNLEVKVVPNIENILTENTSLFSRIRPVQVEDLLAREVIDLKSNVYANYVTDSTVLVTGGGGSIGGELCKQIARLSPHKIIILDICENGSYEVEQSLVREHGKKLNLKVKIESIRDYNGLENIFKEENIDVVFHAAAHKHVPLMEENPQEAVKNNIFGTLNLAKLSDKYKVLKFVQISTDKAVNPTNIMGATKRVCEMIVQDMGYMSKTEFVAVRFGNVLGSNGSVVPLFKEQIKSGGPVTVTHPDIIRYFMTIPEAVSLVLVAGGMAKGGEVFVLDMGEAVKIKDLAENLIRLSGFVPYEDIDIKYTGLRSGEKLFEELLLNEEGIKKTKNKKIYIGNPIDFDGKKLMENLEKLSIKTQTNDKDEIERLLKIIVPNFKRRVDSQTTST